MTARIDPRIMKMEISYKDKTTSYEGFRLAARGAIYSTGKQGKCEIEITNMAEGPRNELLEITSRARLDRSDPNGAQLILFVGRESLGFTEYFRGDLFWSSVSQPPDITVTVQALVGFRASSVVEVQRFSGLAQLREICAAAASSLGVQLNFTATGKQINNFQVNGSAWDTVAAINALGGVSAYLTGTELIVTDIGSPPDRATFTLSAKNGMIGIPEITASGIRATMLWDNRPSIGGRVRIESEFYPAADGEYDIYKIDFDLTTRDNPFYITFEAARPLRKVV